MITPGLEHGVKLMRIKRRVVGVADEMAEGEEFLEDAPPLR